jgi:hypothetical protein
MIPIPYTAYTDEELNLGQNWDKDPESGQPLSPRIRDEIRKARVTQHENAELRGRVAESDRREAFRKAGIPADAKGEMFTKAYPDLTDPTEIKTTWEAAFGPPEPSGAGEPTGDPATDAARRTVDAGAAGAGTGAPGDIDLAVGMEDAFEKGGSAGLKAFIEANGKFSTPVVDEDGRTVYGIKLPDIN